jgi:hypothetical protein
MAAEPADGQVRHLAEGSGLGEQVVAPGTTGSRLSHRPGPLVQVEDHRVRGAHDEQGGYPDQGQPTAHQVWAAAAGHDGGDREPRGGGGPG